MFCLAVSTIPLFESKNINDVIKTKEAVILINKMITPQNKTTLLQNNSTSVAQQNETVVKHGHSDKNWKPKTRQVSADVPLTSTPIMIGDMNTEQSFYPSPLMMYPFPMMNTYYPRYFPYTYPGYQGYPFFG